MANEYKPGDIVQLKSGGPSMTVSTVTKDGEAYWCEWFKGASKERAMFEEVTLKEYEAPKKGE